MDLPLKAGLRKQKIVDALKDGDYETLKVLLKLDSVDAVQEIRRILDDEPYVFTSLCQYGLLNILEYLIENLPVDANLKHNGMTGLQYACMEGHKDVVALLIKNGSQLNEHVWEEQSEFYLATFHGHSDIVRILLQEESGLVRDTTRCYCLFHAACKGGHVDMMQKWLRPDMDVNAEVTYVPSLNECENQYPLYAACEGKHQEATEFLIGDLKAKITQKICDSFPEFISQTVKKLFRTLDQEKSIFCMSDLDLECILPLWFEALNKTENRKSSDLAAELHIDLSKNNITKLPSKLLWEMPDLVKLSMSHNPLKWLPDPNVIECLQTNYLSSLDFSFCKLKSLKYAVFCLRNLKSLTASHNGLEELYENSESLRKWECKYLEELNLSHNSLQHLPQGIQECVELENLLLSSNQLTGLCPPWQCPLKHLDISNNKINNFPPSADQFWAKSLKKLTASNNLLDQIPESVVKMKCLSNLNLSGNKISAMPQSSVWVCPLNSLNLSHNELGSNIGQSSKFSLKRPKRILLAFPGSILRNTMTELDLSHNDLQTLPEGICDIQSLSVLDLSFNPRLKKLPYDMGRLKHLILLELKGLKLDDKEIHDIINSTGDPEKSSSSANEIVKFMERKRRNCKHHDIVKMVVFGCKNLGNQCLVKKLVTDNATSETFPLRSKHKSVEVSNLTLKYNKKFQTKCKRNLNFHIWEMPALKFTSAVHPCFLTQNSLYVLVHDVSNHQEDIHIVSSHILAIQSCVSIPAIIVVGLFPSAMDPEYKFKLEQTLNVKFKSKFRCDFVSVVFSDKASWEDLRQIIYIKACSMQDSSFRKLYVIDREVPESFITAYERIKSLELPVYDMELFTQETGLKMSNFDDKIGDKLTLHEYLLQVGAMVHYNEQMNQLSNFVIINPSWLYNLLSSFLENFVANGQKLMYMADVKKFMQDKMEDKFFEPFVTLLQHFNIAIQITDGKKMESLLIPSLLPKDPPESLIKAEDNSLTTSRFYPLPAVPKSLWSHVISHLIAAIDRFSDPNWKFDDLRQKSTYNNSTESFRKTQHRSVRGLCVEDKSVLFWRTGVFIWHDQGFIGVEQVKYQPGGDIPSSEGILITAKTKKQGHFNRDSEEVSNTFGNFKKLAVMGVVKDELEEVLELFHPKFHDPMELSSRPMALCPNCYNIKPGVGTIRQEITHFYVRDCAQRILWESLAYCKETPVLLDQLMPELLFLELPPKYVIPPKEVEMTSVKLGHGMAGTVSKGYYKGKEVAVKVFHVPMHEPRHLMNCDSRYHNIRNISEYMEQARCDQDKIDTEQRKISNAFSDVRREVGILSKLKHKCIIAFIGVCVRRQVLLIMELAPFGSLRSQLDKFVPPGRNTALEEDCIITSTIFEKDLTYKMILQIASGLSYLHKNGIIFRDLKPENILVMSMDVNTDINMKLSDYGISKFSTPQGMSGLIGTPAYMAPEVIAKQVYSNKIDIYSLGLVIFEILTGIPPPVDDDRPLASQRNIKFDTYPAYIKKVTLNANFLPLQNLMADCWSYSMDDRPSAEDVVKQLESEACMILHDALWFPSPSSSDLNITCIYTCQSLGRWTMWISESGHGCSELPERFMSVYDLKSSRFTVWRKNLPGSKVTVMTKVGNKIWMACEGSKQLEELVRGKENKLEIQPGQTLEHNPTTILCHSLKGDNVQSVVLVGQVNGNITAFFFSNSSDRNFTMITSLTLSAYNAVSNIVSIRENLVVAACGFQIFFLDVQLHFISPNEGHLSTSIKDTLSCFQELDIKEPVLSISPQDDSIWCSFKDTNLLLKVDCDSKEVLESVCFTWDSSRDQIRIEQTSETSPFLLSHNSKCLSKSKTLNRESCYEENNEVFASDIDGERCSTLPIRYGGQNRAVPSEKANLYITSFGSVENIKQHDEAGEMSDDTSDIHDYVEIQESLIDMSKHPSSSRISADKAYSSLDALDEKPPLPPRDFRSNSSLAKTKDISHSLPQICDYKTPIVPRKISNPETEVALTAVCMCSDLLAIGFIYGGFILIPVNRDRNQTNKKHATFPFASTQYPVLRHPKKKPVKRPVLHSQNSMTSTQEEGFISHFFVAENKLVSFHEMMAYHQPARSRSDSRHAVQKRIGFFFDKDKGDHQQHTITAIEMNEDIYPGETQAADDREQDTKPADLIVWGDLSIQRLRTITSYKQTLED